MRPPPLLHSAKTLQPPSEDESESESEEESTTPTPDSQLMQRAHGGDFMGECSCWRHT